ncbi:flagellar assembly protein FliW [Caryophanon latum]|uniref:Flagellar assembly factor FliW n=1 Tax=Caryophanon latum TaxID=33977 RepID=A0A1C0YI48_9BACL|nr:flagellar assembly protein FliW [Caryophanon latum]OCS86804.1 flagellar assembly protein FliW [Caryophanon latum]
MNIETKFLGEVTIDEDAILTFTEGIPGFPNEKKFVLLPIEADVPLASFQSVETAEIGFLVAYPFAFKSDYSFDLSDADKELLQLEQENDVLVYGIVTLKETFQSSTINLLAPIVINKATKLGKQIILQDNDKHPLRYPVSALEGSVK